MKLRNKKTGVIYKIEDIDLGNNADGIWLGMSKYNSLAEFNAEWEDYEEPKEYWWISPLDTDVVHCVEDVKDEMDQYNKEIGNYFKTKEEADKAVEKLKAWKRLKDLGFRFKGQEVINGKLMIKYDFSNNEADVDTCTKALQDVMLLFGGEE